MDFYGEVAVKGNQFHLIYKGGTMKKTFNTLDKVKIMIAILALILVIFAFPNDSYYWLTNIVFILIAVNLIIVGVQSFVQNKRTIFTYIIMVMAIIIISLSIQQLLY